VCAKMCVSEYVRVCVSEIGCVNASQREHVRECRSVKEREETKRLGSVYTYIPMCTYVNT